MQNPSALQKKQVDRRFLFNFNESESTNSLI